MLVSLIGLLAVIVRLVPIITEKVLFHFDSARDWLWVRDLVISKKPILVGPWSSLQGVFYGPLTYYLLAIFFLLFDGQPLGGSIYALMINLLALALLYRFLKLRFGRTVSWIGLSLLAFAPLSLYISNFIFQTNQSLILGVLILQPLYRLSRRDEQALPWLAVIVGLGSQTNLFWMAFLLPYIVFLVYWLKLRVNWQLIVKAGVFLIIPLLPQLVFELRHDFLQLTSVMNFVKGNNQSLGDLASLKDRLVGRPRLFWELLQQSAGGIVSLVALTWVVVKENKDKFLMSLVLLLSIFLVEAILFPAQFKIWYVYGLIPIVVVIMAVFLSKLSPVLVITYLIGFSLWSVKDFLVAKVDLSQNMKLLGNQLEVVEAVIDWGGDEAYAAFTYTEPIYDYPYQYLFWWMRRKTGRGPIKYSYLPDKYDYVLNKKAYDPVEKDFEIVFLIMEPDNPASDYRWEEWLKGFWEYKLVEVKQLKNGVRIEKRVKIDKLE